MLWFTYALVGAFCNATYNMTIKRMLLNTSPYLIAASTYLIAGLVLFSFSYVNGIPAIGPAFLRAMSVTVGINILATFLYYHALKCSDLSLCVPMLSFTPIFLIGMSFSILGELPSLMGMAGVVLIVMGSYVIHAKGRSGGIIAPFRGMLKDRGVFSMLIVAFLFSIASNFDKMVVQQSDPVFGSAVVLSVLGLTFSGIVCMKKDCIRNVGYPTLSLLLLVGAVLAIEAIAVNVAYTLAIVPYVISVKRMGILISVLMGGLLLHEGDLTKRIIGSTITVAGAICVIAFP
jgi:uncharacterized membrane protein